MQITYKDDVTGRSKLEAVVEAWGFVQNENTTQRKYVSKDDWDRWVSYDKRVAGELDSVIEGYNGRSLSSEQDAVLDRIINSVGGAKRVTEEEFIQREFKKIAEAEAEAERRRNAVQRAEAEAEKKKELDSFKNKLKGLFKRK